MILYAWTHMPGQTIATSHNLTPNGGSVREIPLFQNNLGWWNIIIWLDNMFVFGNKMQIIPTATPTTASRTPSEIPTLFQILIPKSTKKNVHRSPPWMQRYKMRGLTVVPPTCLEWTESPVSETHIYSSFRVNLSSHSQFRWGDLHFNVEVKQVGPVLMMAVWKNLTLWNQTFGLFP